MSEQPHRGEPMYLHPLAYLLGLEGIALMRGFCGEFGREFTLARLAEVRRLLDSADELGDGLSAERGSTQAGYAQWAPFYDRSANQLLEIEGPIVHGILDGLPAGQAVDAACGTGRHAAYLAGCGHRVTGVDSSPDMLAVARAKLPGATFVEGELTALPLPDRSADLVVCAIALNHLPELGPAYREFARVLRPGGHLVVSDRAGLAGEMATPVVRAGPDGRLGAMPSRAWRASDHLAAGLPLGFEVRGCQEPRRPGEIVAADGGDPHTGQPSPAHEPGAPPDIWALHPLVVDAANAAWRGNPIAIVLHLQLGG